MQRIKTFLNGEKTTSDQLCQSWLLLGGTGTISTGVMNHLRTGHLVTCLNRGSKPLPQGVEQIVCDVNDDAALRRALEGRHFDVVVDFLTYAPEQAEARVSQFAGRCGRYVFISTAMTYEKPPRTLFVSEKTPQDNPFSPYAQKKIRCEAIFRAAYRTQGFPLTIVRPSYTYGDTDIPFAIRPNGKSYTLLRRLRAGKPVVVPGDGSVFWTITHNSDFARALLGLMQNPDTLGEDFHITQDECMTWDAFTQAVAQAAGAPEPRIVHISTDDLIAEDASFRESLLGDKAQTAVFDNSKLRQYVPGFRFLMPFRDGVRRAIANLDAHPELQAVDEAWDDWMDGVIARHEAGQRR